MDTAEMTLQCLGTADGYPSAQRNHSAYLYRSGSATFLIDCGEPVTQRLLAAGVGPEAIDRIFISHLHFDHVGGFFMLMQSLWLQGRRKDLRVHLPEYAIEPIRGMLKAGYLFDEILPFRLLFESLAATQPIEFGGVRIRAYPTTHLDQCRRSFAAKYPQPFDAFSFLIETERVRIGHTADIGAVADLEPLLRQPLDLLVCELAHAEPDALFSFLRDRAMRRILFVHVARYHWENLDKIRARAEEILPPERVAFARDGQEFIIAPEDTA